MKHASFRIGALLMVLVMLFSLCACGGDATPTTTTAGDDVTTTLADDVTTTVADDVTTTEGDEPTTTVGNDQPTQGDKVTTTKKDTTTVNDPWAGDPWGKATKPTTTKKDTTAEQYNNTLAPIHHDAKYVNKYGIYHVLKGYCYGKVYKTSEWLPIVGYVKNGKVVDSMYTATTIMPSPNHIYHGNFNDKAEWDAWREHTYANLETLNEAAKSVQKTLKLKEYKIKVFLTLSNPDPDINGDWGTLNGEKMTAKNKDQRFTMIKYMIDSYVSEMKTKDLSNIEFTGFYWFDEYIVESDLDWYNRVTDYIRSLGKITIISPFYKAGGWKLCDEAGFDLHSMQSNYFPTGVVGELNCGTARRLEANAAEINAGNIGGIEMEMSNSTKKDGITGWKMTMKVGVETGIVNGYHIHYYGSGPMSVYTLSKERDAYFHSAYDELYQYMHNTLKAEDIWLEPIENEQRWQEGATDWI